LCVLPIFGLHNLPSYYLRFSLLSYHQRFTEWGQVNEELLPNGVLLSYEVFRGSLRVDGQSIANLELLENKDDGGRAGHTLFSSF
jgi:DNA mismatch repair ATPase MutS